MSTLKVDYLGKSLLLSEENSVLYLWLFLIHCKGKKMKMIDPAHYFEAHAPWCAIESPYVAFYWKRVVYCSYKCSYNKSH